MKRQWVFIALFAVIIFALRLYFAFQTPTLSADDGAYFHLRQIENIRETGLPLLNDPLSYGGRDIVVSPVFYYLVAGASLLMPLSIAVKIIPNLFATALAIIIYLIALYLTKSRWISLFTAFLSAFVPVCFGNTINNLSPLTLAVPLLFLLLYTFIRINNKNWRIVYLITIVVLAFTHPIIILFAIGLLCYLLLVIVEKIKQKQTELEISLFSLFFILWSQFLLFKKQILFHGVSVIWQNIPASALSEYFANITVLEAIYQIGILPVFYGVFLIYKYLLKEQHTSMHFIIAFVATAGLLLWFRLIPLVLGLQLLGLLLVILFAYWFKYFIAALKKTRFQNFQILFVLGFFITFAASSVTPSILLASEIPDQSLNQRAIYTLDWLKTNTPDQSVVAAPIEYGHLITSLAGRKNVIDDNFLLMQDAKQRLENIQRLYKTTLEIEAIRILDNYNVNYVILPPEKKNSMIFARRSHCFGKAYQNQEFIIYTRHTYCRPEVVA